VIRQWWKDEPACNIGVAMGTVSGVFAVDIDDDGESELRKLEAKLGRLPNTVEVITARGRHLYFQMPEGPIDNSAGKVAPGIDVRGDGGYVLAPPSVHPSGKLYSWSVDSANAFAAAPNWLLARIAPSASAVPTPAAEWRDLIVSGADEGTRDSSVTRLAGHLLRRHVDPLVVLELLQIWNSTRCRPPLPVQDVERICNSIAGRELKRQANARQHNQAR
jgi:hypothetical protein